MAAVYVSDDYNITGAERFFEEVLKPFFERHIRLQTLSDHPNTTLTDLFHSGGCQQHSVVKQAEANVVRCDGERTSSDSQLLFSSLCSDDVILQWSSTELRFQALRIHSATLPCVRQRWRHWTFWRVTPDS